MLFLQIILVSIIVISIQAKVIDSNEKFFNLNSDLDEDKIRDKVDSLSNLAGLNTLTKTEKSQFRETLQELKVDMNEIELENIEDAKCNHFDSSSGNAFTQRTIN